MRYLKYAIVLIALEMISVSGFATAVWHQKPNFPGIGRHRGTGIAIGDKGYIGLGHMNGTGVNIVYQDWWEYDPATSSWTQKADYPVVNYGAAAFATQTKGYVGGGVFLSTEFYEFDPITNTWEDIALAPASVADNIAFCIDSLGYIFGNNNLYEYSPGNDSWTIKQSPPGGISIWSSVCVSQKSAYVKSGANLYEYKASNNTWAVKTSHPGLPTRGGVAFSINNKCYFLLGYNGSLGNVIKDMWEYDPAANSWTVLPEFPGTSRRFSSAFSIQNIGYIGIGTNGINFSDFWEYNRILNTSEVETSHDRFTVYPCPATTFITFSTTAQINTAPLEITIYNIQGEIVKQTIQSDNSLTVYRGNLSAGHYFYAIKQYDTLLKTGQIIFH